MSKVKKRSTARPEFEDWERAQNNHMTYPEFADSILQAERSHKSGNPKAWWDIVLFCEQNNQPKPAWVREKLIEHAWKQATTTEKKRGQPHNYALNLYIYREVESCREMGHYYNCEFDGSAKRYKCFANKPLPLTNEDGHFSKSLAFKMIREDLGEQERLRSIDAIEKAYYKGKKLFASGVWAAGPISENFYGLGKNPALEDKILRLQKKATSEGFSLPDDVARDLATVFKSDQFANMLSRLKMLTPKGGRVSLKTARGVINEHFKPVDPIEDNYPVLVLRPKTASKSVQ